MCPVDDDNNDGDGGCGRRGIQHDTKKNHYLSQGKIPAAPSTAPLPRGVTSRSAAPLSYYPCPPLPVGLGGRINRRTGANNHASVGLCWLC